MSVQRFIPWFVGLFALAFHQSAHAHSSAPHCARIAQGDIVSSDGEELTLGFDDYGYNYQAQLFVGSYCDSLRGAECSADYEDVTLIMKWNDAWLSNRDCDGDRLLDRHLGDESYRGSGAWLTNDMRGRYELEGRRCHWHQRTVFVAAPLDAELVDGIWYDSDGDELGPEVWNDFYVAERRLRDPCGGAEDESL
jgi:hypothetical protein